VVQFPHAVTVHPSVQSSEVWLRFRGLAFARWHDGRIFFGGVDARQKLTSASEPALKQLLHNLEVHRHPLASDTRHPLYRQQSERWLESIVRNDVTRIPATLDSRFVYAQVFANTSSERGILDLLTVTRDGRLAILELKAAEHIHLPLQAANYWLRIRRHLQQGDFPRYGYFTGIELQPAAPIVHLVCTFVAFSSHYRRIGPPSFAGDRDCPRRPRGKLAPRTSRGHAAVTIRAVIRQRPFPQFASCGPTLPVQSKL
jgi:hypothetical protein